MASNETDKQQKSCLAFFAFFWWHKIHIMFSTSLKYSAFFLANYEPSELYQSKSHEIITTKCSRMHVTNKVTVWHNYFMLWPHVVGCVLTHGFQGWEMEWDRPHLHACCCMLCYLKADNRDKYQCSYPKSRWYELNTYPKKGKCLVLNYARFANSELSFHTSFKFFHLHDLVHDLTY